MSYILTCVQVALATTDVQSILEMPATDEIHMEDRNHHVLPELSQTMVYIIQHAKQSTDLHMCHVMCHVSCVMCRYMQDTYSSCGARTTKRRNKPSIHRV